MSLKDRLVRQIRMDGPIPVSAFMQTCLHDPKDGYYARGAGLGRDFITAPEASQIFGDLIGLWLADTHNGMGAPEGVNLVELGPGRGTLMADASRAFQKASPQMRGTTVSLMEASPELRRIQRDKLAEWAPVAHIETLSDLPGGPMLLIANEFLDCLPARQFVQEAGTWRERMIGLNDTDALMFGIDRSDLKPEMAVALSAQPLQAEAEVQPGLEGIVNALAERLETGQPFHALFMDYGPDNGTPGDSLRAYKQGKQIDPLAAPGEADLTVDVDFARLARLADAAGLQSAGPVTQSAFLQRLGIQARLNALIHAHPDHAEALYAGAQKLVDPAEMGTRFKAICLSTPGLPPPVGFG